MYSVVGCNECSALWVVADRPKTTQCPRCRKRHRFKKLKQFVETDDRDHAREVRSSMLANRSGHGEAFAKLDPVSELERQAEDAGMGDDEFLEASGIDPDEVAEAGERAERGSGGSKSRDEVLREALRELDAPDEKAVVAYAGERGVPADYARKWLEKLRRTGEVVVDGGTYRLV